MLTSAPTGLFFNMRSRLEHNLDTVILFMLKHLVTVRSLIKVETVCDHERWVDLALPNAIEKGAQVLLYMRLARFESQGFSEGGPKGNLIEEAAIGTRD